jgi:hypothetical protein
MGSGEFDFEVANRVHIMPIGFEEERVYEVANQLLADKVVLLGHTGDLDAGETTGTTCRENVVERLAEYQIRVEERYCDLFDLYDALGTIAEEIDSHEAEEVYVNLATGGKVTAIAGMIACMVTDATPYYVQAANYDDSPPTGIENIEKLPRYPIEAPDPQLIEVLSYVREREDRGEAPTKGDLIDYGTERELPFIANHDVGEKGQYRLLDTHIVDPLIERGYISIEKSGRKKVVTTTEEGKNTQEAFRYMTENGIE